MNAVPAAIETLDLAAKVRLLTGASMFTLASDPSIGEEARWHLAPGTVFWDVGRGRGKPIANGYLTRTIRPFAWRISGR